MLLGASSLIAGRVRVTRLSDPLYNLARTTDQFTVTLYSFDGVTVAYTPMKTAKLCWGRVSNANLPPLLKFQNCQRWERSSREVALPLFGVSAQFHRPHRRALRESPLAT